MTPALIRLLDWSNRKGKAGSIRLCRLLRGQAVHPKHLLARHGEFLPTVHPGEEVLDLGCGAGAWTRTLAEHIGASVIGIDKAIDPSPPECLDLLSALLKKPDGPIFVQHDLEQTPLPFVDGRFTLILCLDVIEHLHHRQALLRECRRLLDPETGRLVITGPNVDTSWRAKLRAAALDARHDPDHKVEYTRETFVHELNRGGFEVEQLTPIVYDTPWGGAMDAVGALNLPLYRVWQRAKRRWAEQAPEESTGFWALCRPGSP